MKTKLCTKCNYEITNNNYIKHFNSCVGKQKIVYKQINNLFECQYCKKMFKKIGLGNHIWREHTEEGKKYKEDFKIGKRTSWNKNLKKESSNSIRIQSEKVREGYKSGRLIQKEKGKKRNPLIGKKISDTINKKIKDGSWHYSFSKTRTINYKGIKLYGNWEFEFAKWLDNNQINWRRPKEKFVYNFENKERFYTPDFYLIDKKEYIEIKGYETEKDRCKWKDFPLALRIIKGEELFKLGIISENQLKGIN